MLQELWLCRHGETDWSKTGQHTGRTDITLTENGEAQARALGGLLATVQFTKVLCSPRIRARRTAELSGQNDYQVIDELAEWDYGQLEGRTTAEIRQDFPDWSIWDGPWPGGESLKQVSRRADNTLSACRPLSGRVAIFAHGHILRVLAARWLELDASCGRLFSLSTGSLSVLGFEHARPVIQSWNRQP
jgi:broad specificity phosphatase PhoE